MKYCYKCGTQLEERELEQEGMIPYCPKCKEFIFPIFSTACSMIVFNKTKDKILLIKQYGGQDYILNAGYINKGEDAQMTVIRELKEEMSLTVTSMEFNHSLYYKPSETLMLNFMVVVDDENYTLNHEVDEAKWFTLQQARENIKKDSLAQQFLEICLHKIGG